MRSIGSLTTARPRCGSVRRRSDTSTTSHLTWSAVCSTLRLLEFLVNSCPYFPKRQKKYHLEPRWPAPAAGDGHEAGFATGLPVVKLPSPQRRPSAQRRQLVVPPAPSVIVSGNLMYYTRLGWG